MVLNLIQKLVGTRNDRELKRIQDYVDRTNDLEDQIKALTDEQLKAKTSEFKEKLNQGASLEEILPEAFAVVREASQRTLGTARTLASRRSSTRSTSCSSTSMRPRSRSTSRSSIASPATAPPRRTRRPVARICSRSSTCCSHTSRLRGTSPVTACRRW